LGKAKTLFWCCRWKGWSWFLSHFEVADSSSVRAGGWRAHQHALMWLGIRPWQEGERQWRESRESERRCVPSVPLGRSGFLSSRVLCVYGYLSYRMEGYVPSIQTACLHSFPVIPIPVKFPYVSFYPNAPSRFRQSIGGAPIGMGKQGSALITSSLYSMQSAITSSSKARAAESLLSAPCKVWPQCLRRIHCP
jgi:hypothetical protein